MSIKILFLAAGMLFHLSMYVRLNDEYFQLVASTLASHFSDTNSISTRFWVIDTFKYRPITNHVITKELKWLLLQLSQVCKMIVSVRLLG